MEHGISYNSPKRVFKVYSHIKTPSYLVGTLAQTLTQTDSYLRWNDGSLPQTDSQNTSDRLTLTDSNAAILILVYEGESRRHSHRWIKRDE